MYTRCPKCLTRFKVQPEQLRIREGMVRCGHCLVPFNALESLVTEPDRASQTPPLPQSENRVDFPVEDVPYRRAPSTLTFPPLIETPAEDSPPPSSEKREIPAEKASKGVSPSASLPPNVDLESLPVFEIPPVQEKQVVASTSDQVLDWPEAHADSEAVAPVSTASPAPVVNLNTEWRPYPDEPEWRMPQKPAMSARARSGYAWAIVVLSLLAVFQWCMIERASLAKYYPPSRPVFEAICARFGCLVPLPQDAAALAIEDHDLRPDPLRPGYFMLTAKIKNQSSFVQALPYVELSLNDIHNVTVVRRVLVPEEWAKLSGEDAKLPAHTQASLDLILDVGSTPVAGYFLQPFYP